VLGLRARKYIQTDIKFVVVLPPTLTISLIYRVKHMTKIPIIAFDIDLTIEKITINEQELFKIRAENVLFLDEVFMIF
jgi:hypothetical protein